MTTGAVNVGRTIERRAPRSAGVAGIVFSLLFMGSVLLAAARPPDGLTGPGLVAWFERTAKAPDTLAALYLMPFAGIAFLWFIGVIRDRIGSHEDRFMATVFLGSGVLFVGMLWAAAAAIGEPGGRQSLRRGTAHERARRWRTPAPWPTRSCSCSPLARRACS